MQRLWSLIAVSFVAAILAVPVDAQALEKPKLTIAVGGKTLFYYLPLTIAERNGYFKDEGLDVEILDFPGGAKALQALLGGSADVVSGAYEHTISSRRRASPSRRSCCRASTRASCSRMPKAKAATYKSPADLKGMKIGVTAPGSSTNMFVNILLAKAGLKPDATCRSSASAPAPARVRDHEARRDRRDVQPRPGDHAARIATARSCRSSTRAPRRACRTSTAAPMPPAASTRRPSSSKKNPHTVQAVVNAMVRALRFIQNSTPDQVVDRRAARVLRRQAPLYKDGAARRT